MARRCSVSSCSVKGNNLRQEDCFLVADIAVPVRGGKGKLLAVMDGHNAMDDHDGREVSAYLVGILDEIFQRAMETAEGDPRQALLLAFAALDVDTENFTAGSTLSVVYIPRGGRTAYVGILGDSPVVIYTPGQDLWISPEHNTSNPAEVMQVLKRGGELVNGNFYACIGAYAFDQEPGLKLSRAFGDKHFSDILDRQPEIFSRPIAPGSLILVATDGIINRVSDTKKHIEAIIDSLRASVHPSAKQVVKDASWDSYDNITAIVWHWRQSKAK